MVCVDRRDDLLALDEALEFLEGIDPRKAQIVELRYFGGLSNQDVADALEISVATVKREWSVAKTWLLDELRNDGDSTESIEEKTS
jgi:RNA polymerase sigma factor (sigma-70 family)